MALIETPDDLGNEFEELTMRKERLAEGYRKLRRDRQQLQPLKDHIAARESEFKTEQASLDGEAQEIADELTGLRRRARDSRKAADRVLREAQRQAAADRKRTLADLNVLERDINDLDSRDADAEDDD